MQHREREDEGGTRGGRREGGREVRVWEGVWGWCDERRREGWGESLLMRGLERGMAEVEQWDIALIYLNTHSYSSWNKKNMHKPMKDEALYSKSEITWTEGKKRKENKTVYSTSADTQYHFTPSRKTHRGKPKCHRVWCTTMSRPQLHRLLIMRWPLTADFMQNVKIVGLMQREV